MLHDELETPAFVGNVIGEPSHPPEADRRHPTRVGAALPLGS
jgi:hypothetical protein